MKQGLKRSMTLLLTLLLFVTAWQSSIFTAQAFTLRKAKPSGKDSHYYSRANPFYAGGYLNECTWYAWGGAYEALGAKPKLPTSAAHTWYQSNKKTKACPYGSEPKAGAIMVTVKDGSHGHVAFVEELYSNGTMLISEYNYNVRSGFSTQVIKQLPAGARRGRAHKVLGYIYVVEAKPADTTAPKLSGFKATKKTTDGFRLAAKASDETGVTAVKFQVCTEDQSWKDGVWFDGVRSSKNGCWVCEIPVSAFDGYNGPFTARCRAFDAAGNKATADEITVSLPGGRKAASADRKAAEQAAAGTDRQVSSGDLNGVGSVLIPTLAAKQKSDDASSDGNKLWERCFPASGEENASAAASSNWSAANADPSAASCSERFKNLFASNSLFDSSRA